MDVSRRAFFVGSAVILISVTSLLFFLKRKKKARTYKPTAQRLDLARCHVIENAEDWERIYPCLVRDLSEIKLLGFDCEWVSCAHAEGTKRNRAGPVALLQLATHSDLCVLVRLCCLREVPESLLELLQDRSILKVGVACLDDAKKLLRDRNVVVRGCVDLRNLATRARMTTSHHGGLGLRDLAVTLLGVEMDKSPSIRSSNWGAETLTPRQVRYAALDAVVATHIFLCLVQLKLAAGLPRQHSPAGQELWRSVTSMCQGIVDISYSGRSSQARQSFRTTESDGSSTSGSSGSRPGVVEKPIGRAYSIRRKPLYHNCQLKAPDGQLLCTCDVKKALWYVEKGLGKVVSQDPLTVQLNFEPSGRPMDDRNYYLQDKANVCVVCGKGESYTRKNVVPHEYRKYFPPMMKEHRSHDVVLMCTACHQHSSNMDAQLKMRLAQTCNAPMGTEDGVRFRHEPHLQKVRSAAKALLFNSAKLPMARKQELQQLVINFFGIEDLTEEILKSGMELDTKVANDSYVSHGQKVVEHVMVDGGLVAFEKMWRQHLLDTMEPRFLPALWSVDHSHLELEVMDSGMKQALSHGSPATLDSTASSPDVSLR